MSRDSSYSTEEESPTGPDEPEDGATRRRVLAGGAASWATVALAGCPGGDAETDTAEPAATDTATPTDTPTPTATPEPEPENYVVTAETGTGEVPEGAAFASACSATRRFVPGMLAVFYVGIYDPETGEQLTDEDLDSVAVNVDGGDTVELAWAGDDEENPAEEWAGSWQLPDDISTGTYAYTVEVTDGDANFRAVGILEDAIEVIEYSNPTNYVVTTETFWNGAPVESAGGFVGGCVPERQFSPEMDVTFSIGIYDGSSGDLVGGDALDSVTVESTDGAFDPVELSWQESGEETTAQWTGTLETEALDPGSYGYEVVVTDGEANFYDVGIASNQFTIIEV
ncbi:hypothetical protein [Halosimplex pelagicum]|uniref:Uncharacterized protein n=1 Tax=Halosimplex pelagicum TaxID=869886 RepID=A0A7D5PEL9_9EURY|nr:hypothetical protein [Halosimplex pelagicum]QLH81719.1 hypothetical protein HZS54_08805 [Halosimplex pelagicum]